MILYVKCKSDDDVMEHRTVVSKNARIPDRDRKLQTKTVSCEECAWYFEVWHDIILKI